MASGFVFKGEVWVLGGRQLGGAGLEIVSFGEVFMPKLQKWHLVPEMWLKHLQSLEEKVPCVVCFKGRMFGLKMGSNMVVVWDGGRGGAAWV
uniref:Uncharacterized protein n=1 Tax=Nelumbo nucifera TaxID=4432 RepID=A0A822XLU3_NELNU|nr:TPA_asm: hypothetical protein HUJ06_022146 [Nelumbo nucifera]